MLETVLSHLNLVTDNTLKKVTQYVMVRCLVIVSRHDNVKLARHFQNLVRQCPITHCYFQCCGLLCGEVLLEAKLILIELWMHALAEKVFHKQNDQKSRIEQFSNDCRK